MAKTIEKFLLGILMIAILGIGSILVTAVATDTAFKDIFSTSKTYTTKVDTVPTTQITENQAKQIALNQFNGIVKEVETKRRGDVYFYEFEIQNNQKEAEIEVDMYSGAIIDTKIEDIEQDDEDELPDVPITGTALERASAAALNYIGEGRVTDTEVGDEEGYYEIEITKENGKEVDVHLDENFNVLSVED